MCSYEAIRFKLHQRLLALDASNIELMKLVVLGLVGSEGWEEAVAELRSNVTGLESALNDHSEFKKANPYIHNVR